MGEDHDDHLDDFEGFKDGNYINQYPDVHYEDQKTYEHDLEFKLYKNVFVTFY